MILGRVIISWDPQGLGTRSIVAICPGSGDRLVVDEKVTSQLQSARRSNRLPGSTSSASRSYPVGKTPSSNGTTATVYGVSSTSSGVEFGRRCCRVVAVSESDRSASVRVPQSGQPDRGGRTFWDGATVVTTSIDEENGTATTNGRLDVSSTGATIPIDGGRRRSTDHTPVLVSPRYPAAVSAGPTRDVLRTSPG